MAKSSITKEAKKALGELFELVEKFNIKHSGLVNDHPDLRNQIKTMAKKNYVGSIPISSGLVERLDVTVFRHLAILHNEEGSRLVMAKYVEPHNHFTPKDLMIVTREDHSLLMKYEIDHQSVIKKIVNDFQKKVERVNSPETYMEMLAGIS